MTDTRAETIQVRPSVPEDDLEIVAILNRASPQYPAQSAEDFRSYLALRPKTVLTQHWVAELDGKVRGVAGLYENRTVQRGAFYGYVIVDPDHRRRGAGRQLAAILLDRARPASRCQAEAGARRLYAAVREDRPESLAFAERRGFAPSGKSNRISRLDVQAANLDGFEGVEEQLRERGIRIDTLAALGPDDDAFMRRLYELDRATHADMPTTEEFEFDAYEVWRPLYVFGPGRSADWCWVAMDGDRPVGLARLRWASPDSAWNSFTGVDREYRGRGIARALKLRAIEWARVNGVRYLFTGNDAENERMLAINLRLGYTMLPRYIELLKQLEQPSASRAP